MIKYDYGSSTKCYDNLINRYDSQDAKYDVITLQYGQKNNTIVVGQP